MCPTDVQTLFPDAQRLLRDSGTASARLGRARNDTSSHTTNFIIVYIVPFGRFVFPPNVITRDVVSLARSGLTFEIPYDNNNNNNNNKCPRDNTSDTRRRVTFLDVEIYRITVNARDNVRIVFKRRAGIT